MILGALWIAANARAEPNAVTLSGRVLGASGKYPVYVALWRSDGFLQHPTEQVRIEPRAALEFKFKVLPGRWALSAFEDRNGNGTLDMGLFGPKEPTGFWRPFTAWRKPTFEDVAVPVGRDVSNADITLK